MMKIHAAWLGIIGSGLATAAQAAGNSPLVLEPTSQWMLDFGQERCTMVRQFGAGEHNIRLQIDSFGPNPGYRVMISGDLVTGSASAPITEFRVGYSPDTGERERMTMPAGKFAGENAVSFGPGFLPDAPWAGSDPADFERSVSQMTVEFRLRKPFRLDTGSMATPFAAMHKCIDDLVASWGIDPAEHRNQSRPPMLLALPEGFTAFTVDLRDRYPGPAERRYRAIAEADAKRKAGPVPSAGYATPVRIMIDAAGKPTACIVQIDSADAYRKSVCERFAGPYQPALDAQGHPVASFVQLGIDSNPVLLAPDAAT
jgi:hypothetical protein